MFVFNKFNMSTGTIIYENTQQLVSGLVSYASPYVIETGCRFMVVKRNTFIRKTDESTRKRFDQLTVQFGWDQLRNLSATGIEVKIGRTRLQFDGTEFRAINVNDFGRKYNSTYIPMGVVQVMFEKRTAVAN